MGNKARRVLREKSVLAGARAVDEPLVIGARASRARRLGRSGALAIVALVALGCKGKPRETREDGSVVTAATGDEAGISGDSGAASVSASADVTSGASETWAPGPPVVAGESVDGNALRARTRARLAKDLSTVHVLEGGSARELGERACAAAVPKRAPETKILIKPNLGGFEWFKDPAHNGGDDGLRGRITDPEFVRGIVKCLKSKGHTRITIAEGWGATHADWERLIRVSGYEAMAREEGVRLVAMDDDGVFDVEGDKPGKPLALVGMEKTHVPTLLVPKILAEHLEDGLFISAPKIKAHRFGVFSAALKGMQGTVMLSDKSPAFRQKWRMHRELGDALTAGKKGDPKAREAYVESLRLFGERLSDVLEVEAPHVVLAEGAPAMGGDGFGRQWPVKESVAIGGTNPILVDRVVAEYLGFWKSAALAKELNGHDTSPILEIAAERFGVDVSHPSLEGNGKRLLEARRPAHLLGMAGFTIHEGEGSEVKPGASAGSSPAATAAPGASSRNDDPSADSGVVHATRIAEADKPTLDGRVEAVWSKAKPVRFDTDWAGKPTGIVTEARFLWAPNALYVLWQLEGTAFFVDTSRPVGVERERLYQEDCVELFLGPKESEPKHYFEIESGPFGHYFDLDVDRAKKTENAAWSSGHRIATSRDPQNHTAVLEVALESRDVTSALVPGAKLPLALYRMEGRAPRKYLAFRPTRTKSPNFHVPEAFGRLVIDP